MAMAKCAECGSKISSSASACPHCGVKRSRSGCSSCLAGLIVLFGVFVFVLYLAGKKNTPVPSTPAPQTAPKQPGRNQPPQAATSRTPVSPAQVAPAKSMENQAVGEPKEEKYKDLRDSIDEEKKKLAMVEAVDASAVAASMAGVADDPKGAELTEKARSVRLAVAERSKQHTAKWEVADASAFAEALGKGISGANGKVYSRIDAKFVEKALEPILARRKKELERELAKKEGLNVSGGKQ